MTTIIDFEKARKRKDYQSWKQGRLELEYAFANDDPDYREGWLEFIDDIIGQDFRELAFPHETEEERNARIAEIEEKRRRELAPLLAPKQPPTLEDHITSLRTRLLAAKQQETSGETA